ncbi:MAG: 3-hydroxyacyl-CoA dehydrogenase [Burkholderiales bacterium]
MQFDPKRSDFTLGIIGTGAMGRGIAQVAATGGMRVLMSDARAGAAAEAKSFVGKMLERAVEKGSMSKEAHAAAVGRLEVVDGPAAMAPCHLVIEVIVEDLAAKQALFAQLEGIVGEDCILATNTSSLAVTSIAAKLKRPERFAGMHFFNPVPLMKLVEVIDGVRTAPAVGDALMEVGRRMGREPVRVKDAPGFIVNQVGRGFGVEAAHIAAEGIAGFADIDRIMRDVAGFRMGPFELMELTGLDVSQPASVAIYEQCYHEPRYRPAQLMRSRFDAGIFGRKTNKGFYDYADGKAVVPAEAGAPAARPNSVWVSHAEPDGHAALIALLKTLNAPLESGGIPSAHALILVTPYGDDATACAVEQGLDAKRTVAVDTLFPMVKRRTIMTTPVTDPAYRDAAHGLLASDGVPVTALKDSPGFIAQRIVAMIVNIGCYLAQSRTAAPADVDKGATLGLNYPHGPMAFGDVLGPAKVLKVLDNMMKLYADPRYRPNLWLTRRARLGVSLLTPDS